MSIKPLSPHLQIYKLPLAAIISISHRIISIAFFISCCTIGLYSFLLLIGVNFSWLDIVLFSWLAKLKTSFIIIAISFYIIAEVRYIIWELNMGLSPRFIKGSNFFILFFTLLISIGFILEIWT